MANGVRDPQVKLCQDCKAFDPLRSECTRVTLMDYVHGKHKHADAQIERKYDVTSGCGPAGKFFEPISEVH